MHKNILHTFMNYIYLPVKNKNRVKISPKSRITGCYPYFRYSLSGAMILYTSPASMAPATGARINSHSCDKAHSPAKIA